MREKPRWQKYLAAALLFAAGAVVDALFGFGISAMIAHYASDISLADISSLPWGGILSVLLVLAAGAILFWPSPKKVKLNPTQKLQSLARPASVILHRFNEHRNSTFLAERLYPMNNLMSDAFSLLITFEKAGLIVPNFSNLDARQQIGAMEYYLSQMTPLLRDGHTNEAKDASAHFAQQAVNG
ncbi:hypothetical protein ACI5KX_06515 [Erythrobacter sp. GH1-10]|uniref:hypothetical protein n=1 Tax=Erythrobacter sp. GH1-10 TaxID=3349334 RepID=UPI0038782252